MRLCGTMSQYGVCIVCCAEQSTTHNTHAVPGHAATPQHNDVTLLNVLIST